MTDFSKMHEETPKQMFEHLYPVIKKLPDDAQIRIVILLATHAEITETKEFVEFASDMFERHPELL